SMFEKQIVRSACILASLASFPALAQENDGAEEPRKVRIALGAQAVPSYPGSDKFSIRPLFDVATARGDELYEFEAPDESFGFAILRSGDLAVGPALNLEGSRTAADVGTDLPKVGFTVEAGIFAQYSLSDSFRLRGEVRRGLGGHEGWIGTFGADLVAREGNDWLLSAGPRVTLVDSNYSSAYFSVAPEDSAASGLPAYSADGGVQAVGATVGYLRQFTPRWGIYSYAKYDRLVGDAADSPIVRQYGSRDQISGGLALTYTFGADPD
ncbi:MAG: MipA/OmpV family protein, partial [Allopontixanthobacter sediminis]